MAGQTTSNRTIVALGDNGQISIFNQQGRTDVVVDVVGFYSGAAAAATAGALFVPIPPTRLLDTRTTGGPLAAGSSRPLSVPFPDSSASAGIPTTATAAALNTTEASATAGGFLSVTPTPVTPPATTSDVNFTAGEIRANADLATLNSTGSVSLFNFTGTTNLVVDAFGYFMPAS